MKTTFLALIALWLLGSCAAHAVVIEVDQLVDPSAGSTVLNNDTGPVYGTLGCCNQAYLVGYGPTNTWSYQGTFAPVTLSGSPVLLGDTLILNIEFTSPLIVPFPNPGPNVDNINTWMLLTVSVNGPELLPGSLVYTSDPSPVINQIKGLGYLGGGVPTQERSTWAYGVTPQTPFNPGLTAETPISTISNAYPNYSSQAVTLDSFSLTVSVANNVPEPSTWAMMLIGFAGLGFLAHRRRHESKLA